MPVSYAGIDLLLPIKDVPNDTVKWIETHITPEQIWQSSNHTWQGVSVFGRSYVPWYNPGMGTIRPGHLYWPTGGSRWARGFFFAGKEEVDSILGTTDGNIPEPLVINDGRVATQITTQLALPIPNPVTVDSPKETLGPGTEAPGEITATMYMLPPLPVSQPNGGGFEPVYLLTFVDHRFYWQYQTTGDIVVTEGTTTWVDLFQAVATRLGVTFDIEVPESTYLKPSRIFTVHYEQITKYLDALCTATQRKVVVDLDGTVHIMKSATGLARASANDALLDDTPLPDRKDTKLHSGGRYQWASTSSDVHTEVLNTFQPDNLELAFPDLKDGIWKDTFTPYQTTTGYDGVPSKYTLRATVPAIYSAGSITNGADLQAYTDQFTSDWAAWRTGWLATGASGIIPFSPDGVHCDIEWIERWDYVYTKIHRKHYDLVWEVAETPVAETARRLVQYVKPVTISANTNDLSPLDSSGNLCTWLRLNFTGDYDLTGISGGLSSLFFEITNVGTGTGTLKHQSSSSLAANRFTLPDSADFKVRPGETIFFKWHSTDEWYPLNPAPKKYAEIQWERAVGPMPIQGVKSDSPSSNQDDYPRGTSSTGGKNNFLYLTPTTAVNFTGFDGGEAGDILELFNGATDVAKTLTLKNETTSSSSNQVKTPCTRDYVLGCQSGVVLKHNGSKWCVLAKTPDEVVQRVKSATIGSTTNDYDRGNATFLNLTASSAFDLTGVTGGVAGLVIAIFNAATDDTKTLTLKNSTGSSSTNQILTPCTSDYILGCQEGVKLKHDGSKWCVLARRTNMKRVTDILPEANGGTGYGTFAEAANNWAAAGTNFTGCRAYSSSDQSISATSSITLQFSSSSFDHGSIQTSNTDFTAPTDGVYSISLTATWLHVSGTVLFYPQWLLINVNGTPLSTTYVANEGITPPRQMGDCTYTTYELTAGDVVTFTAGNDDTSSTYKVNPCHMTMTRLV